MGWRECGGREGGEQDWVTKGRTGSDCSPIMEQETVHSHCLHASSRAAYSASNTDYAQTSLNVVRNVLFSFDVIVYGPDVCQTCPNIIGVLDITTPGFELVGVDCSPSGYFTLHAYARTAGTFSLAVTFDTYNIADGSLTVTVTCLFGALRCLFVFCLEIEPRKLGHHTDSLQRVITLRAPRRDGYGEG